MALWNDRSQKNEKLTLPQQEMPRRQQLPKHFDSRKPAHQYTGVMSYHRAETWYAFLDIISKQIEERFVTESFQQSE